MMKSKNLIGLLVMTVLLFGFSSGSALAEGETPPEPARTRPDDFVETFENPWESLDTSAWTALDAPLTIEPYIVGGSEVSPENRYPFVVSLQWLEKHYCGGSLIAPDWVLTAAHCWVDPDNGEPFIPAAGDTVVLGEHSFIVDSGHEQEIRVDAVFVHELYDPLTSFGWDIALLHLSEEAVLNEYVDTVNLIDSSFTDLVDKIVTVAGWGDIHHDPYELNDPPPELKEVDLEYFADSVCSDEFVYGDYFETESMLCAGHSKLGYEMGACQGDSGGPLFYKPGRESEYMQVGIVSWGSGCGMVAHPGVYASLDTLSSWVYKPFLTNPAEVSEVPDFTPRLNWKAVTTAERYKIQVAEDAGFTSIVQQRVVGATNTVVLAELANGEYFWRVSDGEFIGSSWVYDNWSTVWSFTVDALGSPTPTSPVDGYIMLDDTPRFDWTAVAGAERYKIRVSDSADFSSVLEQKVVGATTTTIMSSLPNGDYYWKIAAGRYVDGEWIYYGWSEVAAFSVVMLGKPDLISPTDWSDTTIHNVRLKWSDVPGAERYQVRVYDSDGVLVKFVIVGDKETTVLNWLGDGTYKWKVAAGKYLNGKWNWYKWSDIWNFEIYTE